MRLLIFMLCACAANGACAGSATDLVVPAGFTIATYTDEVPDARQLALAPSGVLFVGTRKAGRVYAVVDADRDGIAEVVHVIARDLSMPSGVAFRDGSLYVAAVDRVLRYDSIIDRLEDPPAPVVVYDQLPDASHHGWKFIAFGPDGRLYVPVGAPCNVCEVAPPFGSILSMRPDGSEISVFARGVRNSVGFDWHPQTGELWFGDNGRDMLGDDVPPCEINRASAAGLHFGFPHFHAGDVPDPEFGRGHAAGEFTPPAIRLGAHVAPLGIEFYRGSQFPPPYRGALVVTEHGSWNRSAKSGYRVMIARLDAEGQLIEYLPFVSGWLVGQHNWGRPSDVEQMPDGSLLIADDGAGAIYRLSYAAP